MPQAGAATAPMLCQDGNRDGGAALWKRPRQGHSEAPGQKRTLMVATFAGPPPRAPAIAQSSTRTAPTSHGVWARGGGGYTPDRSSLSDDRSTGQSCSAQAAIKLQNIFFLTGSWEGGRREGILCAVLYSGSCMCVPITVLRRCGLLYIVALKQRCGLLAVCPPLPFLTVGVARKKPFDVDGCSIGKEPF